MAAAAAACWTQPAGRPPAPLLPLRTWPAGTTLAWTLREGTANCTESQVAEACRAWNSALDPWVLLAERSSEGADCAFAVCDAPEDQARLSPGALAQSFVGPRDRARSVVVCFPRLRQRPVTAVGVLAHELGHVLGLRHEHLTDPEVALHGREPSSGGGRHSAFNARSIMNYEHVLECWNNDTEAVLSELDQSVARRLFSM
eukprot:m51a1_g8542 hypothetical protein (201) ;mRNA; f:53378-53980